MEELTNKTQIEAYKEWSAKLARLQKPVEKIQKTLNSAKENLKADDSVSDYTRNYRIGKIKACKEYINNKSC